MMKTFLRLCLLAILASCQPASKKEVGIAADLTLEKYLMK